MGQARNSPDAQWLRSQGQRLVVQAGLGNDNSNDKKIGGARLRIIDACAVLAPDSRTQLLGLASGHIDREEMISWLLAPTSRDHALLRHALGVDRRVAESRPEMTFDWNRKFLRREKNGVVLAVLALCGVAVEVGQTVAGHGPFHPQGVVGVVVGGLTVAALTSLASGILKGLFRTQPSTAERGGTSVWRTQIETIGRLADEGRYTEADRRRMVGEAEAFSDADRLLLQHFGASDLGRFLLGDETLRETMLHDNPPPLINRLAASWQNRETRLAIGQIGFGKGLLATRLGAIETRRETLAVIGMLARRPG